MKKMIIVLAAGMLLCGTANAAQPANPLQGLIGPDGVVVTLVSTLTAFPKAALGVDLTNPASLSPAALSALLNPANLTKGVLATAAQLGELTGSLQSLAPAAIRSQVFGLVAILSGPTGNAVPGLPLQLVGNLLQGNLQNSLGQLGQLQALAGALDPAQATQILGQVLGLVTSLQTLTAAAGAPALPTGGLTLPGL